MPAAVPPRSEQTPYPICHRRFESAFFEDVQTVGHSGTEPAAGGEDVRGGGDTGDRAGEGCQAPSSGDQASAGRRQHTPIRIYTLCVLEREILYS